MSRIYGAEAVVITGCHQVTNRSKTSPAIRNSCLTDPPGLGDCSEAVDLRARALQVTSSVAGEVEKCESKFKLAPRLWSFFSIYDKF